MRAAPDGTKSEHDRSWAVVSGPAADIRFEPLTRADGIPAERIYQVLHDRRGFLWFTTLTGLFRYDGYQHVRYPGLPTVRNFPTLDPIPGLLFEDRNGNLWVASDVLTRFDPKGTFAPPLNPRPGPPRPGTDAITAIHDGPGGALWVGVSSYRPVNETFEEASEAVLWEVDPVRGISVPHSIPANITSGKSVSIRAIEEDNRGRLWLGTSVGLVRFDPSDRSFQHYPHAHTGPVITTQRQFNALIWDKTGHLWVHVPGGIERFDPETGVFDRFTAALFYYMTADPTGRIWASGARDGVLVFDPSRPAESALQIAKYRPPFASPEAINFSMLNSDRLGNIWAYLLPVGTVYYSPAVARFGTHTPELNNPNSLSGGLVRAFAEDSDGSIWMATTYAGLSLFDPQSDSFTQFRHDPHRPRSLDSDHVSCVYEDRSHRVWVATDVGVLGTFDRKTGNYKPLSLGHGFTWAIYAMFEDSGGRLWVSDGLGATRAIDRATGEVTARVSGYFTREDRQGNLWFGFHAGLNKLDRAGNLRTIPLEVPDGGNPVTLPQARSIYEDADGILWVGSTRGLFRFDPRSEKSTRYAMREGLPVEEINCLLPDDAGNLWLSTPQGISRFDTAAKRFHNYDERDGLQSRGFGRYSCYRANDGRLYFGGSAGFNTFYPRDILARGSASRMVVTSFQVNGTDRPVMDFDAVRLAYRENGFTVEFAALNTINPRTLRYRFKLEGHDEQWTEVDSARRLARYTDIPPGHYVFRAEASSDGLTWSPQGAALSVTILPPWWKTWWALTLAGLLMAGMLAGGYKLRVGALQLRERELTRLVDQRTAELSEARDEAQAARRQAEIARDQAEAANQAKGTFLATMSHELRTPLNAILGFSNLLRGANVARAEREQIEIINRSGEHLLTLINDVLDMAKIEAGKQELTIAPCDLFSVVRNVTGMFQLRAQEKNLAFSRLQSPEFPRYVRTDAPKLQQVLINLMGNAVKFTQEGSITLRAGATAPDEGGRWWLRFEVEDTGMGISPADRARIFEPFVQAGKPSAQKGTGLGLTIARRIVEMMGGTLHLESTPGKGTCFTVTVPAEVAAAWEVNAGIDGGHEFVLAVDQPSCRVLIVDDNPENTAMLRQMLRSAGFQVQAAADGASGVEAFERWRPHFIWMDLRMPGLSGTEAAKRIRDLDGGRDVKMAAMTASAFASERDEAVAAGLDDFILKPFRPEEIFGCMARHLGVKYQQVQLAGIGPAEQQRPLRPEALAAIPLEVRRDLFDAVIRLNQERIHSAIDRVGELDEGLAAVLREFAQRFAYTAMLEAVERAESMQATPDDLDTLPAY